MGFRASRSRRRLMTTAGRCGQSASSSRSSSSTWSVSGPGSVGRPARRNRCARASGLRWRAPAMPPAPRRTGLSPGLARAGCSSPCSPRRHGDLLPAQPGHPAPTVRDETDVLGAQPGAAGGEEPAEIGDSHVTSLNARHGGSPEGSPPWVGVPTGNERVVRLRESSTMVESAPQGAADRLRAAGPQTENGATDGDPTDPSDHRCRLGHRSGRRRPSSPAALERSRPG